jgi:hypothetical protein
MIYQTASIIQHPELMFADDTSVSYASNSVEELENIMTSKISIVSLQPIDYA